MTRMTGPDCAVMCNSISILTTYIYYVVITQGIYYAFDTFRVGNQYPELLREKQR